VAIDPGDLAACARSAQKIAAVMPERLGADGVNVPNSCRLAAWQTVFHFRLHAIPRHEADPLRLPWTPEPGDRDAIAEAARALEG
jgi:histidine triad (HIT) family protein